MVVFPNYVFLSIVYKNMRTLLMKSKWNALKVTGNIQVIINRYLGLIRCSEGATVVFPNTLQHHVKELFWPSL